MKKTLISPFLIRETIKDYLERDNETASRLYEAYKEGYNQIYNRIQHIDYDLEPQSFFRLIHSHKSNIQNLYTETAESFANIALLCDQFLVELRDKLKDLEPEEAAFLKLIYDIWDETVNVNELRKGIELIRHLCFKHNRSSTSLDLENIVLTRLNKIEKQVIETGIKYKTYHGLSNAYDFSLKNGSLSPVDEVLDLYLKSSNKVSWYGPVNKTISELIDYGHSIDCATKIRFHSLVNEKEYSTYRAFDMLDQELSEMGLKPDDFLPSDAKNMSDRVNRYIKNRMDELSLIARISSR